MTETPRHRVAALLLSMIEEHGSAEVERLIDQAMLSAWTVVRVDGGPPEYCSERDHLALASLRFVDRLLAGTGDGGNG